MPQFRKKPVVIEAEQFFRDKHFDGKHVLVEGVDTSVREGARQFFIRTLEGDMIVNDGDWVITGVMGEKYPCKPDIFEATYEAV
jgi:hypothetical protein